ncbi:MAG: hypothetical protein HIU82_06670 [Proteobacteria bacterium]|nr:hypothetical protein [Pseudomonadota bacterium]
MNRVPARWLRAAFVATILSVGAGWLAMPVTPARGQLLPPLQGCNFVGLFTGLTPNGVLDKWHAFAAAVQNCITLRVRLTIIQLSEHCIPPDNPRIAPVVQYCEQMVRQQQEQQAAAARERAAIVEREEEQARAAAALRAERQRQAAAAAVAAADAAKAAIAREQQLAAVRLSALTQKFGPAAAKEIVAGQITTGMTTEEVSDAKGAPQTRSVVPPDDQLWVYPDATVVFVDGRARNISQRSQGR